MRICFVTNISTKDVFGLDFVNYYSKDNDVSVITFSDYDKNKIEGSVKSVYHMDISRLNFLVVRKKVKKLLKQNNPDVVIAMNHGYHAGIVASTGFHPFIWFSYGSDISYNMYISKYKYGIIKYIISKADIILVQDKVMYDRLKQLTDRNKKIIVKHWGVDTEFFKYKNGSRKYDVVNLHGYSEYYYRYVDVFLRAIYILKNKGMVFKPVLVGNNGYYDDVINRFDIQDILIQKKYLNPVEYKNILYNSKILADPMYPRYNDGCGFGIATIEAMSCGTPVLLADRECSMLDGNDKWFYGLIFKHCNPIDLANNIQSMLNDKRTCDNISFRNRCSVEKNFNRDINRNYILDRIKKGV